MARNTKRRKRRRVKFEMVAIAYFSLACLVYLLSSIFVKSYNNTLTSQVQSLQASIIKTQQENDALSVEVNTLTTRDRVTGIAAEDGLTLDQDNIITITKTPSEGE